MSAFDCASSGAFFALVFVLVARTAACLSRSAQEIAFENRFQTVHVNEHDFLALLFIDQVVDRCGVFVVARAPSPSLGF